jgi:hypothetical protein
MDWIHLAQDKEVVGSCERGNKPKGYIKRLGSSWVAEKLLASQEGPGSIEFYRFHLTRRNFYRNEDYYLLGYNAV